MVSEVIYYIQGIVDKKLNVGSNIGEEQIMINVKQRKLIKFSSSWSVRNDEKVSVISDLRFGFGDEVDGLWYYLLRLGIQKGQKLGGGRQWIC